MDSTSATMDTSFAIPSSVSDIPMDTAVSVSDTTPAPTPLKMGSTVTSILPRPQELPKAFPPEPLVTAIQATDTEGVTFPDASTYDFIISKKKRVDRNLDVYYVGIKDMYQRQWSFIIPSPACFVTFTNVYKGEKPQTRALLCPMYGDGTQPELATPFIAFANHIKDISDVLKAQLTNANAWTMDNDDWIHPLRYQDEILMGIPVKVKNDSVRACISACPYNIRCVVKLVCLYVTSQRRGMSLEIVEAFPQS